MLPGEEEKKQEKGRKRSKKQEILCTAGKKTDA